MRLRKRKIAPSGEIPPETTTENVESLTPVTSSNKLIIRIPAISEGGRGGGVTKKRRVSSTSSDSSKCESKLQARESGVSPSSETFDSLSGFLVNDTDTDGSDDSSEYINLPEVKTLPPNLRKLYDLLQSEIKTEEPTIKRVLESSIPDETKKELIQMIEIYDETIDIVERLALKNRINTVISSSAVDVEELKIRNILKEKGVKSAPRSLEEIRKAILALDADDVVKVELLRKYDTLRNMDPCSNDAESLRNYIRTALSLPYQRKKQLLSFSGNNAEEINTFLKNIKDKMDENLYGMKKAKEELLIILNNKLTNPTAKSSIGFCGHQGTGKTRLASVFAEAIGLPFERIALGGLEDSSVFKGSDKHWKDSGPGIILQILSRMNISNGIILFDEIDKLGDTPKGKEVQNALLHITDYTQNKEFVDSYINEFPHDISNMWFMYSMNDASKIDPILLDRLSVVKVDSYTEAELKKIGTDYVLPRALADVGMENGSVTFDDSGIVAVLKKCGSSSGVRPLEKAIRELVSKINFTRTTTTLSVSKNEGVSFALPNKLTFPLTLSSDIVNHFLKQEKNVLGLHTHVAHMYT